MCIYLGKWLGLGHKDFGKRPPLTLSDPLGLASVSQEFPGWSPGVPSVSQELPGWRPGVPSVSREPLGQSHPL